MLYTITYYSSSERGGRDSCNGSLDRASGLAVTAVEQGLARRTEVRDISRQLLFRYPATATV